MQFIRFSDLCANGQAKGKRVFIRADLNVPQDDEGNITDPRSVVGIGLFEVLEQMGVPPLNARVDDRINGGECSRDRWA